MPNSIPLSLEVLTPVHIGNGFRKLRHIDFYTEGETTKLVNLDLLIETVAEKVPRAMRELEYLDHRFSIEDFLRRHSELNTQGIIRTYSLNCRTNEILTFIRNGLGLPLVPGSSLKGAVRTALLSAWFDELPVGKQEALFRDCGRQRNPKFAGQPLEKALFGNDPRHDVMRALRVTDAHFRPADLRLLETRIFNLGYGGSWSWKKVRQGQDFMRNVVEVLDMGARSDLELSLDTFLLERVAHKLHFPHPLSSDPDTLIALVNAHSRRLIESEMEFFEEHDPHNELRDFFNQLDGIRRSIPRDNSAMILRLGWGGGWKTITGDYIPESRIREFRYQYRLGKRGAPEFPKSRTVGFRNGRPEIPLGWVQVTVGEK